MTKYILQANNNSFVQSFIDGKIVFNSVLDIALRYNTIGEAMKTAAQINKLLGKSVVKLTSVSK